MSDKTDAIRKTLDADPRAKLVKPQPTIWLARGAAQLKAAREAVSKPSGAERPQQP